MELVELSVVGFRNLARGTLTFDGGANLILGPNGAGKTSLLEAITVLGNLRSFQTVALRPTLQHGLPAFRLEGRIVERGTAIRLAIEFAAGPPVRRKLFINGSPATLSGYLLCFPVFAITGPDRELVRGGPHLRRALLDRFVFLQRPAFFDELRWYRRILAQRNAALSAHGAGPEMEVWDDHLAAAAAAVVVARRASAEALAKGFSEVMAAVAGDRLPKVDVSYRGEPWLTPDDSPKRVEDLYRRRYNETRERDRRMGFTGDGPHRHDVSLRTAGRAIRNISSSGQSKLVAAALRLATLVQVEKETNRRFPVVVDEIDAELDREALRRLLGFLEGDRQLFLSSTDERLTVEGAAGQRQIWIDNGKCRLREADSDE